MQMVEGSRNAAGMRFAVVVSKFNDFVTDRLQAGAVEGLKSAGVAEAVAEWITTGRPAVGGEPIDLAATHLDRFDPAALAPDVVRARACGQPPIGGDFRWQPRRYPPWCHSLSIVRYAADGRKLCRRWRGHQPDLCHE